ncbi:hypothetical protein DET54_1232 [Paenibacillus pabuli]|uniref:Uncharacterized protein n=1 Tax=Paenibacillus pabuli TaxID=1472 RepID=A0A855XNF0_9BACL|nr:hypothetical protein DET56_12380 [Paenibacillus pabuli]PXV98642.1 hypothetical protein DEU73_1212 [Paenibacillus taichungensis]RAI84857.1 hypothetical protein DET54_1232 [Paenibacillus pabuli]
MILGLLLKPALSNIWPELRGSNMTYNGTRHYPYAEKGEL